MIKINGLDALKRELEQAQAALQELDGTLGEVTFDPNDPMSIDQAIIEMEHSIDEKLVPYSRNEIVTSLAIEMKEKYREMILEKALQSRLESDE